MQQETDLGQKNEKEGIQIESKGEEIRKEVNKKKRRE
jgi:hypothetical protein